MTAIYKLKFNCCENILTLGMKPEVGKHTEHCLHCDTENPPTEIIEDNDYY